jgi:hypothetical protein
VAKASNPDGRELLEGLPTREELLDDKGFPSREELLELT